MDGKEMLALWVFTYGQIELRMLIELHKESETRFKQMLRRVNKAKASAAVPKVQTNIWHGRDLRKVDSWNNIYLFIFQHLKQKSKESIFDAWPCFNISHFFYWL